MKLSHKIKLYLLWNSYAPADEREYLVYHKGWKQSFFTLIGIMGTVPILAYYMQTNAPHLNMELYFEWFWVGTILLAQCAGGYAMRNDDLSLKEFRFFANKEASFLILIIIAILIASQFFFISFLNSLS